MKAVHSSRPGPGQQPSHTVLRPSAIAQRNLAGKLSRISLVAIASLTGTVTANASSGFGWDEDSIFEQRPVPVAPPLTPQKRLQNTYPKLPNPPKNMAKPQGALIVTISLQQQKLKVYDANGLFSESPISSGMAGRDTPTGIFSVIQKSKWHRSNLYSDAPMPFMQRLTWSGIALHAGSLPGYPASHGCIRVPVTFAVQAWSWTRMGTRIVVTHGDVVPTSIAHALLPTQKPVPDDVPSASATPLIYADATNMRSGDSVLSTNLQLRPALSADHVVMSTGTTAASLRARTYIADAGLAMPDLSSSSIASDAPASGLRIASIATDATGSTPAHAEFLTSRVLKKDPAPLGNETPAVSQPADTSVAKPEPKVTAKRAGRIAVYISGKDSRLYVRENFEPLFEVPVTIAPSDHPLGTHLFTAEADKAAPDTLRWSVMTVSGTGARVAEPTSRRKAKTAVAQPAPALPAHNAADEALNRLGIPDETMKQLATLMSSGASVIVSDLAMATNTETGRGTDFVVQTK